MPVIDVQKPDSGAVATPAATPEIINKKELAKRLGVQPRTVTQWVEQRRIPFVKISPRITRFNWPRVVEHLEAKR